VGPDERNVKLHVFRFTKTNPETGETRVAIVLNSSGETPDSPFIGSANVAVEEMKLVHGITGGTGIGTRTWCGTPLEDDVYLSDTPFEEDVTCPLCVKEMRLFRGKPCDSTDVWFVVQP
jgi:hypothetical protein